MSAVEPLPQIDLTALGIGDPLAFCRRALQKGLRNLGTTHLEPDDLEEAHSFLLLELVKLAGKYDRTKGPSFSTWSFRRLTTFGIVNWYREFRGDSRYGEWIGGRKPGDEHRHTVVADNRCECGATFVRNGGREQVAGAAGDFLSGGVLDPDDVERLISEIDHPMLSARARGALHTIARAMAEEGLKAHEVAERLGKTRRDLGKDMQRMREELHTCAR